jgi:hypothetical protein
MKNAPFLILGALLLMSFRNRQDQSESEESAPACPPGETLFRDGKCRKVLAYAEDLVKDGQRPPRRVEINPITGRPEVVYEGQPGGRVQTGQLPPRFRGSN